MGSARVAGSVTRKHKPHALLSTYEGTWQNHMIYVGMLFMRVRAVALALNKNERIGAFVFVFVRCAEHHVSLLYVLLCI
jgi:hypothetical protein